MQNLLTDVPGLAVGNAHDPKLASGVTVVLPDREAVAAVWTPGGAPGGRDVGCLEPEMTVGRVDALVLSGGSAYGLDAASGAQAWLRERGRGLTIRQTVVPIVPQAICFDLLNGGDKEWGRYPPYRELAYEACEAAGPAFELGTAGAGYGATTVDLKGGLGSASARLQDGRVVAALVVVNAVGSAVVDGGPHFWAGALERDGEFGGYGPSPAPLSEATTLGWKGRPAVSPTPGTTIAIIATDVPLTKATAKRMAIMAAGGLARGLRLTFAPMDGDTVFALSTGVGSAESDWAVLTELGTLASDCLARAIARGVHAATSLACLPLPAWSEKRCV